MKNDISRQALEKITRKKITPISGWLFNIKNLGVWLAYILVLAGGGFANSVIIYMLANNDWDIYRQTGGDWQKILLSSLPFFWLAVLFFILVIALINFKKTKHGYNYRLPAITIFSFAISLMMGYFLFNWGMGERLDLLFSENVPYYRELCPNREKMWSRPTDGLLAGFIIDIEDKNNFRLIDFNSKIWRIQGQDANLRGKVVLKENSLIKLIGEQIDDSSFEAKEIRSWTGQMGACMMDGACMDNE